MNDFADRLGVSPAYWSRVEREQENAPRDEFVEKAAAILGVRLDDLFIEAGRLPPDMREDLKQESISRLSRLACSRAAVTDQSGHDPIVRYRLRPAMQ